LNHIPNHLRLARSDTSRIVADMSLALINRTGAYHVCREIAAGCGDLFDEKLFWRIRGELPAGRTMRRILARLMLLEIAHPALGKLLPRRRRGGEALLYMDPLYVMGEVPEERDIVLCHDMGPVTHPGLFGSETEASYLRAFDLIRRGRPGMVFVSEASRDAFVALYGTAYRFLEITPLFVRDLPAPGEETAPAGVSQPYLLTVGALEHRKNYLRTIEAFAASGLAERGFSYAFCGPRGNAANEIIALAKATPGVVHLGYVSDAELQWLYRHAQGFVLVSLLEGFGMPALEAAQRGLVSLIGSGGAQREAAGDGALAVDPESVAAIAAGLVQMAAMPVAERAERVTMVRTHASHLSRERFVGSWRRLLSADRADLDGRT